MLGDWCMVSFVGFQGAKKELIIYKVMKNVPTVQPEYSGVQKINKILVAI